MGIYLHINNITRVQSLLSVLIVFSFNMQTGFNIALIQKKLTLHSHHDNSRKKHHTHLPAGFLVPLEVEGALSQGPALLLPPSGHKTWQRAVLQYIPVMLL